MERADFEAMLETALGELEATAAKTSPRPAVSTASKRLLSQTPITESQMKSASQLSRLVNQYTGNPMGLHASSEFPPCF